MSVRDNGIGIAAGALAADVRDVHAGRRRGDRSQGGLGIGLALVQAGWSKCTAAASRRAAKAGQGSEFIVAPAARLGDDAAPRRAIAETAPASATAMQPRGSWSSTTTSDAADRLAMMLEHDGPRGARGASTARRRCAWPTHSGREVVLLDIGMPGMNGYEVARRLRSEPWAGAMTLVALTGLGQDDDKTRAYESGFDHHLTKPINTAQLCSIIADAVVA